MVDVAAAAMVDRQIRKRGITDARVVSAMERVPRHCFVAEALRERAYDDTPLPIGYGQTISQPYMVAAMTEALCLTGEECVLEVGTGSGYQAAVLSLLARIVYSVERVPAQVICSVSFHQLCRRVNVEYKTVECIKPLLFKGLGGHIFSKIGHDIHGLTYGLGGFISLATDIPNEHPRLPLISLKKSSCVDESKIIP